MHYRNEKYEQYSTDTGTMTKDHDVVVGQYALKDELVMPNSEDVEYFFEILKGLKYKFIS